MSLCYHLVFPHYFLSIRFYFPTIVFDVLVPFKFPIHVFIKPTNDLSIHLLDSSLCWLYQACKWYRHTVLPKVRTNTEKLPNWCQSIISLGSFRQHGNFLTDSQTGGYHCGGLELWGGLLGRGWHTPPAGWGPLTAAGHGALMHQLGPTLLLLLLLQEQLFLFQLCLLHLLQVL